MLCVLFCVLQKTSNRHHKQADCRILAGFAMEISHVGNISHMVQNLGRDSGWGVGVYVEYGSHVCSCSFLFYLLPYTEGIKINFDGGLRKGGKAQ